MSVVIVGGHDRMVSQYKKICKEYNCKAKVFTQIKLSGNNIQRFLADNGCTQFSQITLTGSIVVEKIIRYNDGQYRITKKFKAFMNGEALEEKGGEEAAGSQSENA